MMLVPFRTPARTDFISSGLGAAHSLCGENFVSQSLQGISLNWAHVSYVRDPSKDGSNFMRGWIRAIREVEDLPPDLCSVIPRFPNLAVHRHTGNGLRAARSHHMYLALADSVTVALYQPDHGLDRVFRRFTGDRDVIDPQ
jgi:hypothetical protein